MSDPCALLDQFDPVVTGDPVFANIWIEVDKFSANKDISYAVRAVFLKLWCLQQIQKGCNEGNLAKHSSALDALFDEKDMDEDLASALEGLSIEPQFKVGVEDCVALIRALAVTDKLIKTRAGHTMVNMINGCGYHIPKICKTRKLLEVARMLLSTTTDAYYSRQPPSPKLPFNPEEEFQVQVITRLKLCGGAPSTVQPLNVLRRARAMLVIGGINNIHELNRIQDPTRLGVLTENLEERGSWLFQAAESLSDLDDDEWVAIASDTVDEMKEQEGTVFIINSRQLQMAEAINRKVEALQQDTSKTWYQWKEGRMFTSRAVLLAPPEYLPVSAADPIEEQKKRALEKKKRKQQYKWAKKQAAKQQAIAGPSSSAHTNDIEMEE